MGTTISSGGIIGIAVATFLLKYTNITGCVIVLLFFMMVGFIFATGISIVSLGLFLRQKTIELVKIMRDDFQEFIDFLKEKYKTRKEKREQAKKEIDITPVIIKKDILIKIPERVLEREFLPDPEDIFEPKIVELEEDDSDFKPDVEFNDIREKIEFNLPLISFLDEKKKVEKKH